MPVVCSPTTSEVSETRRGGSQWWIVKASGLASSPSASSMRKRTDPLLGSPVQVPIQRSSRSDSVIAAHTDSIRARKVRWIHEKS